jgi:hypothetical protein
MKRNELKWNELNGWMKEMDALMGGRLELK